MSTSGGVPVAQWPAAPLATGTAMEPLPGLNVAPVGQVNGLACCVPFLVTADLSVGSLGVEVTTAGGAGSVVRLGVYQDSGQGAPSKLLVDAGTIDSTVVGVMFKDLTATLDLAPGWYWTCAAPQGSPASQPSLYCYGTIPGALMLPPAAWADAGYLTLTKRTTHAQGASGTIGALPDPIATGLVTTIWPRVLLAAA